jgi:23S rRNA (adenine2503-C2)-methyltransferase
MPFSNKKIYNVENLLGKTLEELKQLALDLGMPAFVWKQMAEWIYKKRVEDVSSMSNISQKNRALISESHTIGLQSPIESHTSIDGTKKYLFEVDKHFIEAVFIPESDRATLCVSTQVGCKMNCKFCATGKQGFSAQLSTHQILNQIFAIPESQQLTNIVFMGMGEPFDNTENVLKVLDILTADYALAWSPKRITVSTVGLIPGLKRFLNESKCHLAVSLHNPIAEERLALMPAQKAFPISKVIEEIKKHDFSGQRRVSFEYTLFKGINDQPQHIKALAQLLNGLECRINLIRFHSVPEAGLKGISMPEMEKFRDALNNKGITTTIRKSRGEDIFAACGLLSTKKLEEKPKL